MFTNHYLGQFYRVTPGDTGNADIPIPHHEQGEAEKAVKGMLLAHFNRPGVSASLKPHHANLVDQDGAILRTFMVVASPHGGFEIENISSSPKEKNAPPT